MKNTFKSYIGEQLLGKSLHFMCDCVAKLDVRGTIVDYTIMNNELVFSVSTTSGKIIKIGENHPNLFIEE